MNALALDAYVIGALVTLLLIAYVAIEHRVDQCRARGRHVRPSLVDCFTDLFYVVAIAILWPLFWGYALVGRELSQRRRRRRH